MIVHSPHQLRFVAYVCAIFYVRIAHEFVPTTSLFGRFVDAVSSSIGSNNNNNRKHSFISPIRNFGPSWTASSVGGSTITIPFGLTDKLKQNNATTNAVVVIFRSTTSLSGNDDNNSITEFNHTANDTCTSTRRQVGGLRIDGPIYTTADTIPQQSSISSRWTFLGSTMLCSMTGFAPDVDYLTRFLQGIIDTHRTTYESTSTSRTVSMSTIQLVESLSEELQDPGQWMGGRPYGVQVLIIGQENTVGRRLSSSSSSSTLGIFTLDPSGVYRQWRGGTAIGRNGKLIRDQIFDCITSPHNMYDCNDNGPSALYLGLQASILAQNENENSMEQNNMYEAILVWQSNNEFCVAHIDQSQLDEVRQMILNKVPKIDV
jgi:Proteasome subunit